MQIQDTDSPRVAHLVWNVIRGGTEGQCARVAIHLARQGHTHKVAVFRREGFFLDAVEQACGPVYEFPVQSIKHVSTVRIIQQFARWLRREQIHVLHAWDADAAVFGSMAACWAGVPLVTSRRDLGEIYAGWKLALMRYADRKAQRIVVNARAIQEKMTHLTPRAQDVALIPNVLDVEEFDALAQKPWTPAMPWPDGMCIAMVARLDPEKDVATVLDVASQIKPVFPDVWWMIAGDGIERKSLETLALSKQVDDRVVFLGEVHDVPALLKRCMMGVLTPKSNEGLSNTILEYMAAGLPVVATDCGGNRELLSPSEAGLVAPIGDTAALTRAVTHLLNHPNEASAMGKRGRHHIFAAHQPSVVADQFLALYRAIRP